MPRLLRSAPWHDFNADWTLPQPSSSTTLLTGTSRTRLNYEATLALHQYGHVNYLKSPTEAFLKYMLFTEETPLTAPIRGTSDFSEWFAAQGPKDSKGRSLHDFDLQTRLFKYPCSYLIHSETFDHLPEKLRERIYDRLCEILSGKDKSKSFERLASATRQEICQILIETKPEFAERWKAARSGVRVEPVGVVR